MSELDLTLEDSDTELTEIDEEETIKLIDLFEGIITIDRTLDDNTTDLIWKTPRAFYNALMNIQEKLPNQLKDVMAKYQGNVKEKGENGQLHKIMFSIFDNPLPDSNGQVPVDLKQSYQTSWEKFKEALRGTLYYTTSFPLELNLQNVALLKEQCIIDQNLITARKKRLHIGSSDFEQKLKRLKETKDSRDPSLLQYVTEKRDMNTYMSSTIAHSADQTANVLSWLESQSSGELKNMVCT